MEVLQIIDLPEEAPIHTWIKDAIEVFVLQKVTTITVHHTILVASTLTDGITISHQARQEPQ